MGRIAGAYCLLYCTTSHFRLLGKDQELESVIFLGNFCCGGGGGKGERERGKGDIVRVW